MAKDKKIYKLNQSGTLGVSLNKSMKEAGFSEGVQVEWVAVTGGFLLRKAASVPVAPEKPKEEPIAAPVQPTA